MNKDVIHIFKNRLYFYCPACDVVHEVNLLKHRWNGSLKSPTIIPSILNDGCSIYIKGGVISYLKDCSHTLSSQTTPMVPLKSTKIKVI